MDNCIFCKIAAGEIPSSTVYEDQDFRVILDLNQGMKGHMLILPKEHYANVFEIPDPALGKAMILAKRLARAAKVGFEKAGEEYAATLTLSRETVAELERPMIPAEEYIRNVNGV